MRNQKGFTLIEMLLSAGLVGVVAMAGMTVLQTFDSSKRRNESKASQIQLQSDLKTLFSSNSACMAAFTNLNFDPMMDSQVTLRLANGKLVSSLAPNNLHKEYLTEVTNLSLVNKTQIAVFTGGNKVFSTQLLMGSRTWDKKLFMTVPIASFYLQINPANQIVSCEANDLTAVGSPLNCASLGGVQDGSNCRAAPGATSVSCAPGQYLQGFDTEGMMLCRALPPPPPRCTTETVTLGPGTGATPGYWGSSACTQSCIGMYGGGTICAGGCVSGHRGWMFCGICQRTEEVCR